MLLSYCINLIKLEKFDSLRFLEWLIIWNRGSNNDHIPNRYRCHCLFKSIVLVISYTKLLYNVYDRYNLLCLYTSGLFWTAKLIPDSSSGGYYAHRQCNDSRHKFSYGAVGIQQYITPFPNYCLFYNNYYAFRKIKITNNLGWNEYI